MSRFRDKDQKDTRSKIDSRRSGLPADSEGRKASAPLYVMLEPDEKERYEQLAKELNVTMRDLVRIAIERLVAERNAAVLAGRAPEPARPAGSPEPISPGRAEGSDLRREYLFEFVLGSQGAPERGAVSATLHQVERLRRLEDAVARILRRLDAASIRDVP